MWTELRAQGDDVRTTAVKTASAFRVDMTTLARRLRELGHADQGEAGVIRSSRTTKADIVDLNLLVHDELRPPELPRRYEKSILPLYRSETVSPARATDLLFDTWEEGDLPALPLLSEDSILPFLS